MPELPEVETVCAGLNRHLQGATLRDCVLNRANLRFPFPDNLHELLIGATIRRVYRRAKYLLFELGSGHHIIAHLGMSGTMRMEGLDDYVPRKHDHVLWELDDGQLFVFRDPRRFGFMLLAEPEQLQAHPMLAELGPEPLGDDFTSDYLAESFLKRKSEVKVALMDQKLVVGVGNIYASESLFRAGVSPFMPANEAAKQAKKLVVAIQSVLEEAILSGGSSLKDFSGANDELGYFQHAFRVYDRLNQPCFQCDIPVSQSKQSGRSTYFCKQCQSVV